MLYCISLKILFGTFLKGSSLSKIKYGFLLFLVIGEHNWKVNFQLVMLTPNLESWK